MGRLIQLLPFVRLTVGSSPLWPVVDFRRETLLDYSFTFYPTVHVVLCLASCRIHRTMVRIELEITTRYSCGHIGLLLVPSRNPLLE